MRKYIVEFIGTFFLMLSIVMITNNGTPVGFAAIGIGATLLGFIYAGSHISGAHYNPAVTLAMFINKKINLNDMMGYILAQVIAAIFASFTAVSIGHGVEAFNDPRPISIEPLIAVVAEFFGTFALVFIIKNINFSSKNGEKSFYAIATAATYTGMFYALQPISGGSFNPAVALGLCSIKAYDWQYFWVYLVGSLIGAAVAAVIFSFVNSEE